MVRTKELVMLYRSLYETLREVMGGYGRLWNVTIHIVTVIKFRCYKWEICAERSDLHTPLWD